MRRPKICRRVDVDSESPSAGFRLRLCLISVQTFIIFSPRSHGAPTANRTRNSETAPEKLVIKSHRPATALSALINIRTFVFLLGTTLFSLSHFYGATPPHFQHASDLRFRILSRSWYIMQLDAFLSNGTKCIVT